MKRLSFRAFLWMVAAGSFSLASVGCSDDTATSGSSGQGGSVQDQDCLLKSSFIEVGGDEPERKLKIGCFDEGGAIAFEEILAGSPTLIVVRSCDVMPRQVVELTAELDAKKPSGQARYQDGDGVEYHGTGTTTLKFSQFEDEGGTLKGTYTATFDSPKPLSLSGSFQACRKPDFGTP